MSSLKQLFGGNLRQYGMLAVLIVFLLGFQWGTGGKVLTSSNAMNLLNGNSYVLILAIGMLFVIITGQIDLSVGSVAALVGICVALAIQDWGIPWWLGIILGLVIGATVGAWQGMWLAWIGVPGFITTLAGLLLFRGLNQLIGKSNSIPVPKEIQFIGGGYLPELGPNTGFNNPTLLLGILASLFLVWSEFNKRARARKVNGRSVPLWVSVVRLAFMISVIGYLTVLYGTGRPGTSFPMPGLILVFMVLIYHFISVRTTIGRSVYALGGNRAAAALSGINTKRTYFLVMMNVSTLAAVAAIMFIGRSAASGPFDGVGWELDAIAAVFIGGAAVSGGIGTVFGALIGGLVMAVLNNGLQLLGIGSDLTQIIKGAVLLVAVAFDLYSKSQGRFSIIGRMSRKRELKAEGPMTGPPETVLPDQPIETGAPS